MQNPLNSTTLFIAVSGIRYWADDTPVQQKQHGVYVLGEYQSWEFEIRVETVHTRDTWWGVN